MADRELVVRLIGDDASLNKALGRAGTETKTFGDKVSGLAKTALIAGGAAGVGALVGGMALSVKAALDAQQSTARLDQAFKNVGLSAKASADQVDEAEASARQLGFTDDDTRNSLGSLITATHDVGTAMSDMSVAQDIARFKGTDLSTATTMLTTAMTGSQRAAKQLGIVVSPVTTAYDTLKATMGKTIDATEKLELAHAKLTDKMATGQAVIDAVTAKVHGQADAFAGTAAGAMEQFHAQIGHLEEALGSGLLPKLAEFATKASGAVTWVDKFVSSLKGLDGELAVNTKSHVTAADSVAHTGAVMDSATASAIKAKDSVTFLGQAAHLSVVQWEFMYGGLKKVTGALMEFADWNVRAGAAIEAWGKAVGQFAVRIGHDIAALVKTVYDDAKNAGDAIVKGLIDGFDSKIGSLKDHVVSGVSSAWHAAGGWLHGSGEFQFTKYAGHGMADGLVQGFIDGIGNLGNIVSDNLDSQFMAAAKRLPLLPGWKELAKTAAAGPTILSDATAYNNIINQQATDQATRDAFQSAAFDTQFAGAGYNIGMSAAEVYALGKPAASTPTGNLVAPITVQVDGQTLLKTVQTYALRDIRAGGPGVPG